jgi:hypothetical protein
MPVLLRQPGENPGGFSVHAYKIPVLNRLQGIRRLTVTDIASQRKSAALHRSSGRRFRGIRMKPGPRTHGRRLDGGAWAYPFLYNYRLGCSKGQQSILQNVQLLFFPSLKLRTFEIANLRFDPA